MMWDYVIGEAIVPLCTRCHLAQRKASGGMIGVSRDCGNKVGGVVQVSSDWGLCLIEKMRCFSLVCCYNWLPFSTHSITRK